MGYDWDDLWHRSPVETVQKQYKKVIRDVEAAVRSAASDLQSLSSVLTIDAPSYRGGTVGDPSSGRFVTEFETALGRWETAVDGLIGPYGAYRMALEDLERRLSTLRSRKAILDRMAREEDARKREYTYADIPF